MHRFHVILLLLLMTTHSVATDELFQDQVASILAERCLACHNDHEMKGDFSVESRESFFRDGYVEPGNPENSHLIELVSVKGGKAAMPKSGPPLIKHDIEVLKKWIADGAVWPEGFVVREKEIGFDWWSLQPIERPEVPALSNQGSLLQNEIDAFILRELSKSKLNPSPAADRRTLIRRLAFDLTGLPPTYEQTVAFENDSSPDAYEKLVDSMLASPRYGERWARHWLDVVKYADTCGYDKDKLRPNAWPYRDYVIRSFNDDKPYSQFVKEQIAGDQLYPDSPDGILGLGFVSAGPWDFIGHVEVPESKQDGMVARNLDRDEMVSNTLNTFCSVTIQCARCHDHKFDPFTQEHYYGLQAVFAAIDRADRVYDADPEVDRDRENLKTQIAELQERRDDLSKRLTDAIGKPLTELDELFKAAKPETKQPQFGYHSEIASVPELEKWVEVKLPASVEISKVVLHPCHDDFAGIGSGFGFPKRFRIEIDKRVIHDQTEQDLPNPGLEAVEIPVNRRGEVIRIVATKLAERKKDFILALAELRIIDVNGENRAQYGTVTALDSIEMPIRWAKTNLNDGIWYATDGRHLDDLKAQRVAMIEEKAGPDFLVEQKRVQALLAKTRQELKALPAGKLVYAAATDFSPQGNFKPTGGRPRLIRVLQRGDINQPGQVIGPGTIPLANHGDYSFDAAKDKDRRAALAEWIVDPDNPLTWRSIVNRVWHYHFDRGIVDTPNDLGRMGGKPTHPELLDWLAAEFRDRGGSIKWLHRKIVTSATYRQSSQESEAANAIDADNRLLWRMPRRRLSAEEIRDAILQASGQLNLKMGGPGFQLFALEKTEHSPHYEYHKFDHSDPATYRRSIYRFVVRSQPDPYMTTLDCADSSQSTPVRNETQTALQSLAMFNSDFNLRMAGLFANEIQNESRETKTQVRSMIERTLSRGPTEEELNLLVKHAREHGLTSLARVLFNLSEFVYVD